MKKLNLFFCALFALSQLAIAQTPSCPQGLVFNTPLNRCLTSAAASQVTTKGMRCQQVSGEEARRQCYEDVAKETVSDAEAAGKIKARGSVKDGATVAYILNSLVGIYVIQYFLLKGESCPAAWSVILMGGGAITSFGGEIVSSIVYGNKMKKNHNDFKNLLASKESEKNAVSVDVQKRSFELLEQQEQGFQDAAKWKEGFYLASTALYTAAAVAAGIEIATMTGTMGTSGASMYCPVDTTASTPSGPRTDPYETLFASYKSPELPYELRWFTKVPEVDPNFAITWTLFSDWLKLADVGGDTSRSCTQLDEFEKLHAKLGSGLSAEDSLSIGDALLSGVNAIRSNLGISEAMGWFPCKSPTGRCDTLINTKVQGQGGSIMYNADKNQCQVKGKPVDCPPEALQNTRCRISGLMDLGEKVLTLKTGGAIQSAATLAGKAMNPFDKCNCPQKPPGCVAPAKAPPESTIKTLKPSDYKMSPLTTSIEPLKLVPIVLPLIIKTPEIALPPPAPIPDQGKWWQKALASPWTRFAMAGVMGIMSGKSVENIKEKIKASEDREKFIAKLRQQVEGAAEEFSCAEGDRDNAKKPNCYCYTEDGSFNQARSKSQTCSGVKPVASAKALTKRGATSLGGCLSRQGVYQANCECKEQSSSDGGNGCYAPVRSVPTRFAMAGNSLGTLGAATNQAFSNDASLTPVRFAEIARGAAAASSKALANLKAHPKLAKDMAMAGKYERELGVIQNRTLAYAQSRGLDSLISRGAFTSGLTPEPDDLQDPAIEKIKEEVMKDDPSIYGSEGSSTADSKAQDDYSLDGLEANEGGVTVEGEDKLAEIQNAEFEYKDNDINPDVDADIFQILSKRYRQSGYRRLFE